MRNRCSFFVLPVLVPIVFKDFVVFLDFTHFFVQFAAPFVKSLNLLSIIVLVKDDLKFILR